MSKAKYFVLTSAIAGFLALVAVAWACNPQAHKMRVVSTIYYPTGSTSVLIAEGYCDTTVPNGCAGIDDKKLYQDTVVSTLIGEGPGAPISQTTCTSGDTPIGNLKYLANGKTFTNDGIATLRSGLVPNTSDPGAFVVCAGMDPQKLWDNIIVL